MSPRSAILIDQVSPRGGGHLTSSSILGCSLEIIEQPGYRVVEYILESPDYSLKSFLAMEHRWQAKVDLNC